jgi:hypothetical protein
MLAMSITFTFPCPCICYNFSYIFLLDADAYGSKHGYLFTNDNANIVEGPFLKAMQSADPYLQKAAALSFACLLTVCKGNEAALVNWVLSKLSSNVLGSWEIALPVLTTMSRSQSIRERFIEDGGFLYFFIVDVTRY